MEPVLGVLGELPVPPSTPPVAVSATIPSEESDSSRDCESEYAPPETEHTYWIYHRQSPDYDMGYPADHIEYFGDGSLAVTEEHTPFDVMHPVQFSL